MNDPEFDMKKIYHYVKNHKDLVNILPDELGTSFPVPIVLNEGDSTIIQMSFFHLYMGGINESLYDIASPNHKTLVRYLDGSIVDTQPATSKSFGMIVSLLVSIFQTQKSAMNSN